MCIYVFGIAPNYPITRQFRWHNSRLGRVLRKFEHDILSESNSSICEQKFLPSVAMFQFGLRHLWKQNNCRSDCELDLPTNTVRRRLRRIRTMLRTRDMQDRRDRSGAPIITFLWLIGFLPSPAASFGPYFTAIPSNNHRHINIKPSRIMLFESIVKGGEFCDFGEEDLQVAGVVIEDLSWRVHKLRLEEENKKRFLKAKPRFLPYEECRKWVQAFSRWNSEKEW